MYTYIATASILLNKNSRLVMFDRDNTLVEDQGYTYKTQDLRWKPEAIECLKVLRGEFPIFVVSNQSGISKALFTAEDSINFFKEMNSSLKRMGINQLDGYVFCPHLELQNCYCRKPRPTMLSFCLRICQVHENQAVFVGDAQTDAEAAELAKIPFFQSGPGLTAKIVKHLKC